MKLDKMANYLSAILPSQKGISPFTLDLSTETLIYFILF